MAGILLQVLGAFGAGDGGGIGGAGDAGGPGGAAGPGNTGDPRNAGNPKGSGGPGNPGDPGNTGDPRKTKDPRNIADPRSSVDSGKTGDPRNIVDPRNVEDPWSSVDSGMTVDPGKTKDPRNIVDPRSSVDPEKMVYHRNPGDPRKTAGPRSVVDPRIWDSSDMEGCLLLGERSHAKTALLFQAAAAVAGQWGRRVLFLAPRPVQVLPAALLHLEPCSLRRVQFVYPQSAQGLLHAVASLHESPDRLPSLILLDGLDEFLQGCGGQELSRQAALLAALLRDTTAWVNRSLAPSAQCQVIVTLQTLNQKENAADLGLQVIERYFPVKCMMSEQQCHMERAQIYLVSFSGLIKNDTREACVSQIEEDCTWELLFEDDNISRIHRATRERT